MKISEIFFKFSEEALAEYSQMKRRRICRLIGSDTVCHGKASLLHCSLSQMMDGWMICDFTSFSTVFQSYQDDERLVMKGCVQWKSVYG